MRIQITCIASGFTPENRILLLPLALHCYRNVPNSVQVNKLLSPWCCHYWAKGVMSGWTTRIQVAASMTICIITRHMLVAQFAQTVSQNRSKMWSYRLVKSVNSTVALFYVWSTVTKWMYLWWLHNITNLLFQYQNVEDDRPKTQLPQNLGAL